MRGIALEEGRFGIRANCVGPGFINAGLGADLIKADPTDEIADYHRVVEVASGIPVLVRGGGRVSDEVLLQRTVDVLAQGASGIVYGRNIIQHPNPAGITAALMAVLHENASVQQALAVVGTGA